MKKIIKKYKIILVLTLISTLLIRVACQQDAAAGAAGDKPTTVKNPAVKKALTKASSKYLSSLSSVFKKDIEKRFGFCITDVDADWNEAFNFDKDTRFLENCVEAKGDVMQRICTAAEIKFYFQSFYSSGGEAKQSSFLKPNKNCNLTTWLAGCEPGWACSAAKGTKVDLKNDREMPVRVETCSSCCEGFFCPRGITCMIPCPLGSYCPLARLNRTTGVCDPYKYQLPPGKEGHACGGADLWADITSSREVFCSAGSYCPSTTQKLPCTTGHFCRAGSVEQQKCFKLATCEPMSTNQNITAYGLMIFLGLFVLLLIFYNCSDQALATREKKKEKSREKAVQSVRENAEAQEKWKSAKDIAKKHAVGLQTQLSRTFSKVRSQRQPDLTRGVSQARPGTDAALPPMPLGTSKQKKKEKGSLTNMLREMDDDPDNHEGFNVDIGSKLLKKVAPKGKQLHTQSQIFRYAYGQIEKEKALQEQTKDLTFSGVLSMANEIDIPKRLTIEILFKELTITLKGKNIHLMRSVSGKLSPGRVSAVMGPSGAGKTTFLSALTGKAPGCTVTGKVLINGKDEPIQAYKKIIGYVPQDDIVHGNLTVEENLWFSARCRLSSDLLQQEKVLVIERVIESLGLQAVRHSLVGTVEKRGISGGQKKRVNVGLEMVMEPSLLILDEPTSGLDSSSSQLLLKALRREALEGVNICMVIHQPSYTLFNMFDELILLAKGGLIVYHGSVKKVEEYFAGLGITVPDRANPPDYFIDILEGIIKLPPDISVTSTKQLPVRWMLHNGYPVPMDMMKLVEGAEASTSEDSAHGESIRSGNASVTGEASFAGDLWRDMKYSVTTNKDNVELNVLKSLDLSQRNTPGPFKQSRYYLGRIGKQRLRESRTQGVDYLILLLAGICLGTLAKVSDETFGAVGYTYTVIAVSLLCKIAALRSFSPDKLHYWRERSSGMSSLAYFLAKDTVDHFNTIVKPIVYLSMFYFFNNPRSSITDNYLVLVCLVYCVTGIAYVLAILFEPAPAQLWSVLLPVVLTLIATHDNNSNLVEKISDMCYTKWAMEAFVVSNAKRYSGVWLITRCGSLMQNGYDLKHFNRCLLYLILTGIFSRGVAFFSMLTVLKK